MSGKFLGFKVFPHIFHESAVWQSATIKYRAFFIEILMRCVWKKTSYIANGHLIELEVGSFACSLRNMVEMFNPTKKKGDEKIEEFTLHDIRGAIRFFTKHKILAQKIAHQITILTICDPDVYNSNFSFDNTVDRTTFAQSSHSHLKEPSNQITKEKKKNKKEKPEIEKKEYRENVKLSEQQYAKLIEIHGETFVNNMLDELSAYKCAHGKEYDSDYHNMVGAGWVLKKCKENLLNEKKTKFPATIKEQLEKHFKHGEKYNEAECFLNDEAIAFFRPPLKHMQLKFNEGGFWDRFDSMLKSFGIINFFNNRK